MNSSPQTYPAIPRASPIPVSAGIGLKPQHFSEILGNFPPIGWFEVHPENYMMDGGPMLHYLRRIREHYPLSFHSIGMSLGSADGVDKKHIHKIRALIDHFEPALVSDHLSWSRWDQTSLNDLLPMPYTEGALNLMAENIEIVQEILGRSITIENPSSYFDLSEADMHEWEFLVQLVKRSGSHILLDINNVFVSACNHGWDAMEYIRQIPPELVLEIHLAGHKVQETDYGEIRIDDHGSAVCDEVWNIFRFAVEYMGPHPTLIEWDTDVPAFDVLQGEARRADSILFPRIRKAEKVQSHAF